MCVLVIKLLRCVWNWTDSILGIGALPIKLLKQIVHGLEDAVYSVKSDFVWKTVVDFIILEEDDSELKINILLDDHFFLS